mmetsp:Transcript_4314/g.6579  ORF Transcript_4314/g.6579 Transcript_4314/m.6579 type:complete len:333 (+) Transcript_4314:467-1465(+)
MHRKNKNFSQESDSLYQLPNELFKTDNVIQTKIESIAGHIRVFRKIGSANTSFNENEYLLRCHWSKKDRKIRCLDSKELEACRTSESTPRIGPEYQAIMPKIKKSSYNEPKTIWRPMNTKYNDRVKDFLVQARNNEYLRENMMIKFITCTDTWGKILESYDPNSCDPNQLMQVKLENRVVGVPRKNIIGHFDSLKALHVLYNNDYNFDYALSIVSSPDFEYSSKMIMSDCQLDRFLILINEAKILSKKIDRKTVDYFSRTKVIDEPCEKIDIGFILERGKEILQVNKKDLMPFDIVDLALKFPIPGSSKKIKNKWKLSRLEILRIIRGLGES